MVTRSLRSMFLAATAISGVALFSSAASAAGVTVTAEAPGVQYSQQANTITETFDSMAVGISPVINSVIGTYTAGGYVSEPNTWGGSNQTQYLAVGSQSSPTTTVTLTLATPATYFGFYLGALDELNNIDFYDGGSLLTTLNIQTLSGLLSSSGYDGNSNFDPKVNTAQKYAYLNVFADPGVKITSVVFRNLGTGTGLESDSHSVITAVPEPSTLAITSIGALGVVGVGLRRRMKSEKK